MKIDWTALGTVGIVSIVVSVIFVALLAGGIRSVSAARIKRNQGVTGTGMLSIGHALLGLAGLLVLFGLYLIVPQFH
jgi:hypothetical protein